MSYVKLDTGILNSTLWIDRDAREMFITALLMAVPRKLHELKQIEAKSLALTGFIVPAGEYGFVEASGPGICRQAGLDLQAGLAALERLGSPDQESRSASFEGRRLIRVDGGFVVLNYMTYRDKDHTAADRQRRFREGKRNAVMSHDNGVTSQCHAVTGVTDVPKSPPCNGRNAVTSLRVTQAEAEAEKTIPLASSATVVSAGGAPQAPPRAASPPEFPKPDDPRVLALHGIACAARCRLSILDAQQWVAEGLTEAQILEATARAKAKKPGEVIPAKFLQCFVNDVKAGVGGAAPEPRGAAAIPLAMAAIAAKEAAGVAR